MIILSCKYCGSTDLQPNGSYCEAICGNCGGRHLYLWEVAFMFLKDAIPTDLYAKMSEQKPVSVAKTLV